MNKQVEQIRAEIERRLRLLEHGDADIEVIKRVEGVIKGYKSVLSFIDSLPEEHAPIEGEFPYINPADTLEGEIDNIWSKLSQGGQFMATKEGFAEVVTHFAKWQKEQMMKKAVTTTVVQNDADDGDVAWVTIPNKRLYEGKKIKLIIIKEN